jgi:ABC-2 type transport system ATP-binding protein
VPSIEMERVTKWYRRGTPVLEEVTLSYRGSGTIGYLGPNGAGKSTTLKLLVGLLRANEGTVRINGADPLTERDAALWDVGAVIENPVPYPSESVFDALNRVGTVRGLSSEGIDAEIDRCDAEIGLPPLAQRCGTLSKGQRQRVALSAALVGDPKLLLLDEPTDGMDPAGRIHIRSVLRRLRNDHLVLMSSHGMADVREVCDRLVFIDHGRILLEDTTEAVVGRARSRSLEVEFSAPLRAEALASLRPWVEEIAPLGERRFRLTFDGSDETRARIVEGCVRIGPVRSVLSSVPALETAYLEVIGAATEGQRAVPAGS